MKITSFVQSQTEIDLVLRMNFTEVIFSCKGFSRLGDLDLKSALTLNSYAQNLNLKTVFELDRLYVETDFEKFIQSDLNFLNQFNSIRVMDHGVFYFLKDRFPRMKFQLMVETGHHNEEALIIYQEPIERLILSSELSIQELDEIHHKVKIPTEILGLGPILLFDSPRALLSPLIEKNDKEQKIQAIGKSEESPHKGFDLIENDHGTLMYHFKDICLLKYQEELKSSGVAYFRIDLRLEKNHKIMSFLCEYWMNPTDENLNQLSKAYSKDWMRGFFHINKTDVLFSKLKNTSLNRQDQNYIGEVIDVIKDKCIVVKLRNNSLKLYDYIKIINPHGIEKTTQITQLRNHDLLNVEKVEQESLAILPFISGVLSKSQVYST